jgi:hypothetical protein
MALVERHAAHGIGLAESLLEQINQLSAPRHVLSNSASEI